MNHLSDNASEVLKLKMNIDIEHLMAKLYESEISPFCNLVIEFIDSCCRYVHDAEEPERLNELFNLTVISLNAESEVYFVLDSIRMAFFRYISGGVHDLYVFQENESWFPKIVLVEIITPNDISTLNDDVTIYRGCNKLELVSNDIGQSWTTNIEVARQFAFQFYKSQEWFVESERVVLKSICKRRDVLYSNQTAYGEYEVVVKKGAIEEIFIVY